MVGASLGMTADQCAAIFIRLDGNLVSTDLFSQGDGFVFVKGDNGSEDRHLGGVRGRDEIGHSLGGDLGKIIAADERTGPLLHRKSLRYPRHETPEEHELEVELLAHESKVEMGVRHE